MQNIWQCSDYHYTRHTTPTVLARLHSERADKLKMYALAGGMTFYAEHVMHDAHGTPVYISYEWLGIADNRRAYLTMELLPNEMLTCGYYMRTIGMSSEQWLIDRLLLGSVPSYVGMHNPMERAGTSTWSASRTLEGIL